MRYCLPCNRYFKTDVRFLRHLTQEHGAPRSRVARTLREFAGEDLVALQSDNGTWFLMVQAYLL